jgi:hypothetical protein
MKGVLPFFVGAFTLLALASVVNLINVLVALVMSAQSLPMYAGLEVFPRRILWPIRGTGCQHLPLGHACRCPIVSRWADVALCRNAILFN